MMKVKFNESNGIVEIDDARMVPSYRNFSGVKSAYNREGDRNFALLIDDEDIANDFIADGWNVKIKPPREEGDTPFMYIPIKVKFNSYGPKVYLVSGDNVTMLTEETIGCLDDIEIINVRLDIRPYKWEANGKTGIAAYLSAMEVTQNVDRFARNRMYTR